jgi:hypothetical protein
MACEAPILSTQAVYELEMPDGVRLTMHSGCHGLWVAERILLVAPAHSGGIPISRGPARAPLRQADTHATPLAPIRAKLRVNRLPARAPLRARTGDAGGQQCSGCGLPIEVGQVWELEFPGGPIVQFHADCEQIWRTETGN